jgi:hypothetical protein
MIHCTKDMSQISINVKFRTDNLLPPFPVAVRVLAQKFMEQWTRAPGILPCYHLPAASLVKVKIFGDLGDAENSRLDGLARTQTGAVKRARKDILAEHNIGH